MRRERRASVGMWVILALALALRLWRLDDKNLWLDESFSWRLGTSGLSDLLTMAAGDIHPPLYYLMLKGWIGIAGDSLVGLRSLSVAWSLAAAYLLFRLAGRDLPRVTACAVLFWFALSPHAIAFSQEARMYAAVTACTLGACLAYRHWVDSGYRNRTALAGYALCVALSLYLHYFTALVIAAIWLHAVLLMLGVTRPVGGETRRLPWVPWLLVHAAVAVIYLPWVRTAMAQVTHGQSWRQVVTVGRIPIYVRDTLAGLVGGGSSYSFASAPAILAVSVLALGLLLLAVATVGRRDRERDLFFIVAALVPVLLGIALLPFAGHMDLARYLPFAVPLTLVAAARGFTAFRLPAGAAAGLIVMSSLATLPGLRTYYDTHVKDSDARPIVAFLTRVAHPSAGEQDPIFIAPGYMDTVVEYISRNNLTYRRIEAEPDFWRMLSEAASPLHPTWLIVDYRWPGFADLARDARVEEERVPLGRPDQIKLFRVRPVGEPGSGR